MFTKYGRMNNPVKMTHKLLENSNSLTKNFSIPELYLWLVEFQSVSFDNNFDIRISHWCDRNGNYIWSIICAICKLHNIQGSKCCDDVNG